MTFKSQAVAIQNLEIQMGQIAKILNRRPQGALPSNTEVNPKNHGQEQCKAVTLRSGKQLEESNAESSKKVPGIEENKVEEKVEKETVVNDKVEKPSSAVPTVPFPQQFQKQKLDKEFSKFLEVFKKFTN